MNPIVIGVIGIAALFFIASRKKKPSAQEVTDAAAPPEIQREMTPEEKFLEGVENIAKVGTLAAGGFEAAMSAGLIPAGVSAAGVIGGTVVAAGTALGSAELNQSLTGDKGTGISDKLLLGDSGYINPLTVTAEYYGLLGLSQGTYLGGAAYSGGRVVGRELDQALGGTGTGTTGMIAQLGLGITAATYVVMGGAFASILGFFFLQLTALVYAIGSPISDANRLAYGQAGARKDYQKHWEEIYYKFYDSMHATHPELSHAQLVGISYPFADGYMMTKNYMAYEEWMHRGRGFLGLGGVSERYHAGYGQERGYFVGDISPDATLWGWDLSDVQGLLYRDRAIEPHIRTLASTYYTEQVGELDTGSWAKCFKMGAIVANVELYTKWMAEEPHGAFVGDFAHAKHGRDNWHFKGTVAPGGRLWADGWRIGPNNEFIVETKMYEWWVLAGQKEPSEATSTRSLIDSSWFSPPPPVAASAKQEVTGEVQKTGTTAPTVGLLPGSTTGGTVEAMPGVFVPIINIAPEPIYTAIRTPPYIAPAPAPTPAPTVTVVAAPVPAPETIVAYQPPINAGVLQPVDAAAPTPVYGSWWGSRFGVL